MARASALLVVVLALLGGCAGQSSTEGGLYGDEEGVRWADGSPDFSPARSVLLIPINKTETGQMKDFGTDDNCFYASATGLKRFYEARGAAVTMLPVNTPEVLTLALDTMIKQKKTFDRIVYLAHGGWHGPMFLHSLQIGLDWPKIELKEREGDEHKQYQMQKVFLEYGARLNKVLARSGWMWIGSCNSATEGSSLFNAKRYTDVMACAADRMAYGQATKTACWDVEDRVKKLEDGIKTPMLWRSNPANLPAEMTCFGDSLGEYPPLRPPPDLMPPPGLDAGVPDYELGAEPPKVESSDGGVAADTTPPAAPWEP